MSVPQGAISLSDFLDRMHFISEEGEERLRNDKDLTVETSMGFVEMSDEPQYGYINAMLKSEVGDLGDIEQIAEDGTRYIEYSDLREVATPVSASRSIVGSDLDEVFPGRTVKVTLTMSQDDDGNEYLNAMLINPVEVMDEGIDVDSDSVKSRQRGDEAPAGASA